jgi:hypothetical protein
LFFFSLLPFCFCNAFFVPSEILPHLLTGILALGKTRFAIHGAVFSWFEWNLALLVAFRTSRFEHLSGPTRSLTIVCHTPSFIVITG